jgi:hypothetical protein
LKRMRIVLVIGAIVAALVLANAVSASAEVTHSASPPSNVPPVKCNININGNSKLTDNADCEQLANSLVDKVGSLLQGL